MGRVATKIKRSEYRVDVPEGESGIWRVEKFTVEGLPQPWFDAVLTATRFGEHPHGFNPSGHVVWGYDAAGVFGQPVALTVEGESIVGLMVGVNHGKGVDLRG